MAHLAQWVQADWYKSTVTKPSTFFFPEHPFFVGPDPTAYILKAVKPIQMFKIFYGKYPNQETIRAVCNINNKQYKEALKIAMNDSNN
mgnify:CR=1 FL=1